MTLTDDLINPSGVITRLIEDGWSEHNTLDEGTVDERDIKDPTIIEVEDPQPGQSTRELPSTIRGRPALFVWDTNAIEPEKGDIHHLSEDYGTTVRAQIVVANGLNGRSGGKTRNDYIRVITSIRQANRSPQGGVAGSQWATLKPGTIDRTPTEYTEQWRANIDFVLDAYKEVI